MGRIHEEIVTEVSSWAGVETRPHRFGGVEFRVGRRELGHLHGDRLADLPFPVRVRQELVAAGKRQLLITSFRNQAGSVVTFDPAMTSRP